MRTGRPSTERQNVIEWLREYLSGGPRPVKAIRERTCASWRTTNKVKQALGARSKVVRGEWFWYIPVAGQTDIVPKSAESEETEFNMEDLDTLDDTPVYTEDMIRSARFAHLNRHEDERIIIRQLIADCRTYPNDPPYPESYIRAVVAHVIYGKPKPKLPDGIEEPF